MSLYFIPLVLKQVNVVVAVTLSMTYLQKYEICVPDNAKYLNVKVVNLMSRTNETRHIKSHETCKCKCRLDASFCNSKQRRNDDKCQCECKELIDKGDCDRICLES